MEQFRQQIRQQAIVSSYCDTVLSTLEELCNIDKNMRNFELIQKIDSKLKSIYGEIYALLRENVASIQEELPKEEPKEE